METAPLSTQQNFYSEVGRRINTARKRRGLTQQALASLVSLSRASITNIEKGKQKLLLHTLVDIATALHVAPANLLPSRSSPVESELDKQIKGSKEREWIMSAFSSIRKAK